MTPATLDTWSNPWPCPYLFGSKITKENILAKTTIRKALGMLRRNGYPVEELNSMLEKLRMTRITINGKTECCRVPSPLHLSYLLFYNVPLPDRVKPKEGIKVEPISPPKIRGGSEWIVYKSLAERLIKKAISQGKPPTEYLQGFINASQFAYSCPKSVYEEIKDMA
jgi:hypothetical protein